MYSGPPHVLMILEGGPLDGEEQIVLDVPRNEGATLTFNQWNHQVFDPTTHEEEEVLLSQGIVVTYRFLGPGRAPDPEFDTWESSWVFEYAGGAYLPTPERPPAPAPLPTFDI